MRSEAIGLRSSCDASATNARCRAVESSSAASVAFVVTASRPTSSCASGTGTRRDRSPATVISASSARTASTGCSARRVTSHVTPATTASSSGSPTSIERVTVPTALRAASSSAPACTVTVSPAGVVTSTAANR
ncbi:hypothetical protein [Actinomadura sp. WMMB 499]|uniref:hypothetical protein n=1 Tax=Actinomadura sp. WMMB 499 TaxID=1219491 RepID=UPI0034A0C9E2